MLFIYLSKDVIMSCWKVDPKQRLSFAQIVTKLQPLLSEPHKQVT